jgi:hypothetical protein
VTDFTDAALAGGETGGDPYRPCAAAQGRKSGRAAAINICKFRFLSCIMDLGENTWSHAGRM